MELFIPSDNKKSLRFETAEWLGGKRVVDVDYHFFDDDCLQVTIENVYMDDFEIHDLKKRLIKAGVISNPDDWSVDEISDTDGSCCEDQYTTVSFVKTK
jgi:hypothetical protein